MSNDKILRVASDHKFIHEVDSVASDFFGTMKSYRATVSKRMSNMIPENKGSLFTILLYVAFSSSMLVVNKVAVTFLPAPATVLFCQLAASAAAAKALGASGVVEVDALCWDKVSKFYLVAFIFLATIFTNMKTLQYANVETFIVFRSSTPLLIALLDNAFLGRELPNARSFIALFFITIGALGYVTTDSNFHVAAYSWVFLWFMVFSVDMVYIKHIVDSVPMTSWGRVYYQNLIALMPLALIHIATGEAQEMWENFMDYMTWNGLFFLLLSCLCGVGMSYSGFCLRKEVSATTFTVVGIICKIGTVVINVLIWDKHATPVGLLFLMLCMTAGFFYQQAPLREAPNTSTKTDC